MDELDSAIMPVESE